ncbi:Bcubp15 [Botrytis cinerea B05.10]|uniref:ubiquitinyl hydrolase 1 n=1 Tax=Botryotinia fuckeliana (strain B05.10) TaxID=332648 RepID=A0A384JNK2_BOTFB|nr:Bcubp15 [Botrytis cinerea B05.10]ATZ51944.1 Bcubp15 [Botrytis cinerea B05.10]
MDPSIDADIQSPENMIVDPDEYVEPSDNEKDDIAIIDPDEPRPTPADDYEAIRELVLPPLDQQPPIIETVHHTWEIKNWQGLQKREHGPIFHAGGYPWRILMFPYGNNSDNVSFYLEHGFEDGPPDDFVCCLQFGLVLWNPNDPTLYTYHTAHHRFTKEEGDWGFTRFVETRKLHAHVWPGSNPPRPLVESGEANMTAYVKIVEDETGVLWHNFNNYDSKKETGFVGLKNQGATCYLNSLIQSLYFTNAFRKAVYQIPTQDEDTTTNSAYTLQRLFYQLQSSSAAVSTNELTKSFGWDTKQIFEQQDVQELSRKLMEVMEKRMKGTEAENVLPKLFCGKVRTYISCINVDYESRRVEDFWDVQLNVSGNKDIEASFRDYIQVETMDGDNQYFAGENYKLQDAKKGVIFESFPEVLHLQLKRFEYDIERDSMMKVNDRYEFPDTFDAAPYLSDDADRSESWIYKLHGVLVHSGDLNAGHYYAFIKPEKDGWFYKYDDDKVTKATMREVLEDNYGGEMPLLNGQVYDASQKPIIRHNSAYMLVYIREARLDEVLLPVTNADTPAHLQRKLEEEAAFKEARRKEREEQHLYLTVRVITQETYAAHGGHDLTVFDRSHDEDPAAAKSYKLLKKCTIRELIKVIGKDTGTDPRRLRVWFMVNRQNKTTRPDTPVLDYDQTIEEAHLKLAGSKTQELRLWAETAETVDSNGDAVWPAHPLVKEGSSPSRSDEIVIFLKWFNVDTQSLVGCGHIYISSQSKVEELAPFILKRMNWPEDTRLKLYEEIKPDMIEPMKAKQSLKAAELQDGDIVCFQRASEGSSGSDGSDTTTMVSNGLNPRQQPLKSSDIIDDARLYYDFLRHRRLITFHCHPTRGNKEFNIDNCESFTLVLSAKHTYDQVAAKVGEKLSVEPTHIRFWTIALNTGNPKTAIRRTSNHTLVNMVSSSYASFAGTSIRSDALFFEVLDISLAELDTKKPMKVSWISEGVTKEEPLDILVPKTGTVDDIVSSVIKKAQLEDEEKGGPIRVYETHSNKIHRELSRGHLIKDLTDYIQIILERIPEEELAQPNGSQYIHAFHFHSDPTKAHSVPFKFLIFQDEIFSDTKKRLEKRTGIKGKNLEKIKFAIVKRSSYTKPIYLNDDDTLWDMLGDDDDQLGLDHIDKIRNTRTGMGDLFLK